MLDERQKFDIFQKITVANTVTQSTLDDMAIKAMVELLDNQGYEFNDIQAALNKCCIEVKGRLRLKDIIDRLPKKGDELPSADELWGAIYDFCTDERKTFILPDMAFKALESTNGGIYELIQDGDKTGARMAFKAAYERLSQGFNGKVQHSVRLGTDTDERKTAIQAAYKQGLIDKSQALQYLPDFEEMLGLLPPPNPENVAKVLQSIAEALSNKVQK